MPVKGRGVFPTRPIPAGELIIKFEGPVYDKATMAEEKDFSEAIQVRAAAAPHAKPARLPASPPLSPCSATQPLTARPTPTHALGCHSPPRWA